MTDYKAIKGKTVQHVASDLDSSAGEGQIWFNTTSSDYKTIIKAAGAWATGNVLNTGRSTEGAGTQTAGLVAGGAPPITGKTEEYDGTSWVENGDLGTARYYTTSVGSLTAALVTGGFQAGDPSASGNTAVSYTHLTLPTNREV